MITVTTDIGDERDQAFWNARRAGGAKNRPSFNQGYAAAVADLGQHARDLEALLELIGRWVPAADGPTLRELTSSVPAERIDAERAAAVRLAADKLAEVSPDSEFAVKVLAAVAHRIEVDGIEAARRHPATADYATRHRLGA